MRLDLREDELANYKARLRRFLKRRGCPDSQVDDITSHAFQYLASQKEPFEDVTARDKYLFKVAEGLLLNFHNDKKRRHMSLFDGEEPPSFEPDAFVQLKNKAALKEVGTLIKAMPKQKGYCARLFLLERRTTREIAIILRITESAVKSHVSQARKEIRERVDWP